MDNGFYYDGEDLKFQISVTAVGFDQGSDNYNIDFYSEEQKLCSFTQEDVKSNDGKYYLPVPSNKLQEGPLKIVVTAFVPDSDFESGYRKEIAIRKLKYIKGIL